ncbi:MAG: outer membrane beta-barrel protein, partial [Desulfocapsa sp.]|nr:outer membrane beta-barrel protein [Desulfocapsa sp.]
NNPAVAQQDQQSITPQENNTAYSTYIENKLSIGARFTHRTLTDSDSGHEGGTGGSGTYLGTIYGVDEIQNYFPNLFANYAFSDFLSIELAYDKIEAETLATSIQHPSTGTKSDGDVSLTGFTLTVIGSYPNQTKFTPYGGIGLGYFQGDFEETDHWGLGYYSEEHYIEAGSPGTPYNGRTKTMTVDNALAVLITVGTQYALPYNCYLDASIQYIKVDADATYQPTEYGIDLDYSRNGTFPLDNVSFRLGIAYTF